MTNKWKEVNDCINKFLDSEIQEIEKCPISINKISKDPIGFISHVRCNLIEKLSEILDKD